MSLSTRAFNVLSHAGLVGVSPENTRQAIEDGRISKRTRMMGDATWKEVLRFAGIEDNLEMPSPAVSLRDYFAGEAMQGFVSSYPNGGAGDADAIAGDSYALADAMLAARKEEA